MSCIQPCFCSAIAEHLAVSTIFNLRGVNGEGRAERSKEEKSDTKRHMVSGHWSAVSLLCSDRAEAP